MNATIDQVALLPVYIAAGTAVLAFLADMIAPGYRRPILAVTLLGTAATAVTAWIVGAGHPRGAFCVPAGCSLVADRTGALVAVVFALATLVVLALSGPALTRPADPASTHGGLPAGEYCFLLACSMTGGVVLGYSRDLITLLVALETLTLPLYALVALRRRRIASAEGATVFYIISVVSGAITLMGAALLYAATGAVHLGALAAALTGPVRTEPLVTVGVVLLLAGLAFKVAAVPMHAWAPAAYDGAPTPIAAYLSTASKLGGVVAIIYTVLYGLRPALDVAGPILAAIAVVTMTVGNLVALRQRRMVRLLAWSSIAQTGYILAPLGALAMARTDTLIAGAVSATIAYTVFYIVLELGAFGAVIAWRGAHDGGAIDDYRGAARRSPFIGAAAVLALIGLAGLPPGLAGLFAKVVIVRSVLTGGGVWLAVIIAANAVIGLAYYARVVATMFTSRPVPAVGAESDDLVGVHQTDRSWLVLAALAAVTIVGLVIGFAPELVLRAADLAAAR